MLRRVLTSLWMRHIQLELLSYNKNYIKKKYYYIKIIVSSKFVYQTLTKNPKDVDNFLDDH